MIRLFIYTKEFDRLWKSAGFGDTELRMIENKLIKNPSTGKVISGTYGLRKFRWNIKGKGKSGGLRILYVDFPIHSKLFLITLIKKSERENITQPEKKIINKLITEIKNNL